MIAGIFTAGCTYVSFQQIERNNANGHAAMTAKQVIYELENGKSLQEALPVDTNISTTITPFVFVYDNNKNLVASSSDNSDIVYPNSCLEQIDKTGENRVTWQPEKGLRFATVGIKYKNGYVIGAYSLSESENTTSHFTITLLIGCILYAALYAILLLIYYWIIKIKKK